LLYELDFIIKGISIFLEALFLQAEDRFYDVSRVVSAQ